MTELSDEEIELLVTALDHYHAYLVATKRGDRRFRELADRLKKKGPGKEEPERTVREKRG